MCVCVCVCVCVLNTETLDLSIICKYTNNSSFPVGLKADKNNLYLTVFKFLKLQRILPNR